MNGHPLRPVRSPWLATADFAGFWPFPPLAVTVTVFLLHLSASAEEIFFRNALQSRFHSEEIDPQWRNLRQSLPQPTNSDVKLNALAAVPGAVLAGVGGAIMWGRWTAWGGVGYHIALRWLGSADTAGGVWHGFAQSAPACGVNCGRGS
jgi:hypothetical protein